LPPTRSGSNQTTGFLFINLKPKTERAASAEFFGHLPHCPRGFSFRPKVTQQVNCENRAETMRRDDDAFIDLSLMERPQQLQSTIANRGPSGNVVRIRPGVSDDAAETRCPYPVHDAGKEGRRSCERPLLIAERGQTDRRPNLFGKNREESQRDDGKGA